MKNKKLLIILLLSALLLAFSACGNSPYDEYARAYEMLRQESSFATSGHDVTYTFVPATGEETTAEATMDCQVVKTEAGSDGIGSTAVKGETNQGSADEYTADIYIRDGREYYVIHDPDLPEDTRGSTACYPDLAFKMATEGVFDLPQEVIASQSAEDTDAGRLLTFTLDPEMFYFYLYGKPDSQTLLYGFREPPVYTALLDEEGRLKRVTYSSCLASADAEPSLWQRDVQVDFLQYGDIELDFPELNEKEYPDYTPQADQAPAE